MSVESYLQAVPKAELHLHLQGSIRPATLLILAQRNGVELPARTVEGLQRWFTYRDFAHFVEIYTTICRCLRTAEDYELVAYECAANLARQNCRYAEVTFTPGEHEWSEIPREVYLSGLRRGRQRAWQDFGVELNWVFDIVRDAPQWEERADYVLEVALEGMKDGVVALGLAGTEANFPAEQYAPWFVRAVEAGLHSTPHAGETAGPGSIWSALLALAAERIGHGVRAIEDPRLVEYLVQERIPLEVCPTSNVRLGVYPSLKAHPLRRLYEAGVVVTVNSDDPPLFNTNLNHEVMVLWRTFGLDVPAINEIILNGVRYAFVSAQRRQELEAQFRAEMESLKVQHLTEAA